MKLNTPSTTFFGKFRTILIGYMVLALWMLGVSHFLNFLFPPPPPVPDFLKDTPPPIRAELFIGVIWAPFWEEMFCRHAFGLIVKRIGNQFLLPAMIISSAIFAMGHGDDIQFNVMKQGIMGMIFFYVYIKNGYSVASSIILHSAWNLSVMFAPGWIW